MSGYSNFPLISAASRAVAQPVVSLQERGRADRTELWPVPSAAFLPHLALSSLPRRASPCLAREAFC